MAYAGNVQITKGTATQILAAINALKAANTINGVTLNSEGESVLIATITYDATAGGGQTAAISVSATGLSKTLAAVQTDLDTAAGLATVGVDVCEVETFGEFNAIGLIVYK